MKVNPKCKIEIMHSKCGLTVITKSWSAIGWEWLGPKHPELPRMLQELHETGKTTFTDAGGTLSFKRLDDIYMDE